MKSILFTLLLSITLVGEACTTFVLKDSNNLVFGRNLDWVSDNGVVVVNKRGVSKTSLVFMNDQPISWTSKYGSVTFNQFGKEFPFGGMNEKGLVVELMVVRGSYPAEDERKALNELQWVQYQLDNARTIEEVIASDKKIRISGISQNLHFLICDITGNITVVEFNQKGMVSYRDQNLPFPVLENDPYKVSLKKEKNGASCRFNTVVHMLDNFSASEQNSIDYSFRILDKVALDGSWSIVYDLKNKQIHFKSASYQSVKTMDCTSIDYSCKTPPMICTMNLAKQGVINSQLKPYEHELNQEVMMDGIKTNEILLPQNVLTQFYSYSQTCKCN
ncbi:MAG: linear amide C-N hydrolase [Schleiferiaceae bacterium]|jgi:choloylglycine hydrolase|nr:linear amide C-N hydrolase [Schleiferiaceae bacterium]